MPRSLPKRRKSEKSRKRIDGEMVKDKKDKERTANRNAWIIGLIGLIIIMIPILFVLLATPQEMPFDESGSGWVTESGLCRNVNVYKQLSTITREGDGWNITLVLWQGEFHDNITVELKVTVEDGAVITETRDLSYLASELRNIHLTVDNVPEDVEVAQVHVKYLECDGFPDPGIL